MEEEYNVLNDMHQIFNIYKSQCAKCALFEDYRYRCKAFPDAIPEDLLSGESHKCVDFEKCNRG